MFHVLTVTATLSLVFHVFSIVWSVPWIELFEWLGTSKELLISLLGRFVHLI